MAAEKRDEALTLQLQVWTCCIVAALGHSSWGTPAEPSPGPVQAQDGEQLALKDLWSKEGATDHSVEEKGKKSEAEIVCLVLIVEEADKKVTALCNPLAACVVSCSDHQPPYACDCSQVHFCLYETS